LRRLMMLLWWMWPRRLAEPPVDSVLRLPLLLSSRLLPLCPRAEIKPEPCRAARQLRVGPSAVRPTGRRKLFLADPAKTRLSPCYPAVPDALAQSQCAEVRQWSLGLRLCAGCLLLSRQAPTVVRWSDIYRLRRSRPRSLRAPAQTPYFHSARELRR